MKNILSRTSEDTFNFGRTLGSGIKSGITISLEGDLGSGKTTFTQGLAKGLGVSDQYIITSPTFTLINEYPAAPLTLYHLDLYRLSSYDELSDIGFEELLKNTGVIVVEWPQILKKNNFPFDMNIKFDFDRDYNRIISLGTRTK